MRQRIQNMKIRTKILVVYVLILCISIGISAAVFMILNENYVEQQIGEASVQTAEALKGNLSIMFENVEQFSNLIYFDKSVQEALNATQSIAIDPTIYQTIQKSLVNMLLSADYIESVFVFDRYLNNYSSQKIAPISIDRSVVRDSDWYKKADEMDGETIYISDTEGAVSYPTRPDRKGISLIRAINSETDYKRIAMLLININESTIRKFFDEVGTRYGSSYCIVNENNEFIVRPSDPEEEMMSIMSRAVNIIPDLTNGYQIEKIEQNKYCVVRQELGVENWYLVGILPISQELPMGSFSRSLIALIVVLNIIVIAICSMALVRLIFRPISEIEQYMAFVERAEFLPIPVEEQGNNEIIHLKRGFNSMVCAIGGLLETVKEEEKSIARGELELLQAQINPHFLYNTLDAISALSLTQDFESCFKMTQALGQFYRNSLNSGKQLVTVEDEIDCVKNYITILNIRYDNKIKLVCEIQQDILQLQILKLVLQPVVENAVYHGIRGKECEGTIFIRGYSCEDEIILSVSDDGIGMTEEKIEEILNGNSQKDKSGFGLFSAMQRISLFYEMENPVTITSEIGSGTEIMICLRMLQGDRDV